MTNAASETTDGPDQTFTSLPALSIDDESVSQVSSVSARLSASLNPYGTLTGYRFQYITQAAFQANGGSFEGAAKPVDVPGEHEPQASAGSGVGDVPLSVLVEGLTPGTAYRYRLVASNALLPAGADGAEQTFTTQAAAAGSHLIDGRAWEQVSPVDKNGAALESMTLEGGLIQAAEDGGSLAYIAKSPVDSEPSGTRAFAEQQFVATRGPGGWSTSDITPPKNRSSGYTAGSL